MRTTEELDKMYQVVPCKAHGMSPIPMEGSFSVSKEVTDVSGFSHGVATCAMKQGGCKLTLNVKDGIIQEALIETIGCSGMTHSASMASEILPGLTILEAINTDLVCDAINVAMREIFLNLCYGRSQSAFTKDGLAIGSGIEDLGASKRSMVGTAYGSVSKGPRYLELTEGYVQKLALDSENRIIGYKYVNIGRMMDLIAAGENAEDALNAASGYYGRFDEAVTVIDQRHI